MKSLLLITSLLTICLSACNGGKEKAGTTDTTREIQPLTLGTMPTLESFPFIVAGKQGIYDSLGIKVNFIHFYSAVDRDKAFLKGQIDGMITDYFSAARMQVHYPGMALVMKNNGYFCFIAGKKSGISQLKHLTNKNIAVSRGTVIDYATDQLLYTHTGLSSPDNNLPEIRQIPLRLNLLHYGQIDATFLPDPYATIAMKDGNKSLLSTRELNIHLTGTAFSEQAISEKRKEISLLIEGYNLAIKYIQSHPQSELTLLLTESTGIPESLAGLIVLPTYTPAGRPDTTDISKTLKWLKKKGYVPDSYRGESLVDTTFIEPNSNKN